MFGSVRCLVVVCFWWYDGDSGSKNGLVSLLQNAPRDMVKLKSSKKENIRSLFDT